MNSDKRNGRQGNDAGSVLVMVLWILILVSFLAGQYLAHNREKADMAQNAWTAFRQRQAICSVTALFSADGWPVPDGTGADGHWFRLFPDDMTVWTRVDKESTRTNLNSAGDAEIKQKTLLMMGDDHQRQADAVSDCILDWRDPDNLLRLNGAEEKDYAAKGLPYKPADGPFNVMSELLLVMGVTPDIFWGNPVDSIETDLSNYYVQSQPDWLNRGLSNIFTIYDGDDKRLSLLVPGSQNGYLYENIIMAKNSNQLMVVDRMQFLGTADHGFDRLAELDSRTVGLGGRGN